MQILSIGHGFRQTNTSVLVPTLTISGFERNNFLIEDMKRKVVGVSLTGERFGVGSNIATLEVLFENGMKDIVDVECWYSNVNFAFERFYDEISSCANVRETYDMFSKAIDAVFNPSKWEWKEGEEDLKSQAIANYRPELYSWDSVDEKHKAPKEFVPPKRYKIRKFTPTECLRLMGVSDRDIEKLRMYPFHRLVENPSYSREEILAGMTEEEKRTLMNKGISDTQLYKMAGNSIVVPVLEGIFRNMEFEEEELRVFTAFSGYDSQCMALRNIGTNYRLVGWSEIDKYAIKAHDALFPEAEGLNFGDISKIDWSKVPDFDLFTYSFPCTDISNAGKQAGFEEGSGTRSSLLWECRKAVLEKRPKYLLMENVKQITSKKFLPGLLKWQEFLSQQGYVNFIEILNAKDYGIPQNRERCFLVSILDAGWYQFPEPTERCRKLVDLLEDQVDAKYYLDQKRVDQFIAGLSDERRAALEAGRTA